MAYDNIELSISNTIKKIAVLWFLFSIINITFIAVYSYINNETNEINKQILLLSEINIEATSILYYNSQKNISSEVDYEKTLLNQWILSQQGKFTSIIPNSIPEIELLDKLGRLFYSADALKIKNQSVQNYQNLSDQLDLLKRVANTHIDNSIITLLTTILTKFFLLFNGIILLFLLLLTSIISKNLQKKLLSKNEFILEDIWNELQDLELDHQSSSLQILSTTDIPNTTSDNISILIEEAKNISVKTHSIKEMLLHYNEQSPHIITSTETLDSQMQEKILGIQKLLSRLFTRAERASSLAKASTENGFQAGILALNISIEAARAGNAGKNFIPISERVKDFSEKSSQIGNAILEELKDANLSIRKAYAVGKGIIDTSPENIHNTTTSTPNTTNLHKIIEECNDVVSLTKYIQNISLELENTIQVTSAVPQSLNKNNGFLKAILVRSFERLYRLNYGIDPPSHNKQDTLNKI